MVNKFMNFNQFRNPEIIKKLVHELHKLVVKPINIMEVCGTHTMAIAYYGLRSLFPPFLKMLSGPGCPVCVTSQKDIDTAIELSKLPDTIITTFGDMIRVPGSRGSLDTARADGADIRIVYSPADAVEIARDNPNKNVIFIGVGFETTSPTIAASVITAKKSGLKNFFVYPAFKLVPPALNAILSLDEVKIDGFILPGHVSAILGVEPYEFVAKKYKVPCVITGFEPVDILQGLCLLIKQINSNKPEIEIEYTRSVRKEGNPQARKILFDVFEPSDAEWREIGVIPDSGLKFKPKFKQFNAKEKFKIKVSESKNVSGCICGKILTGVKNPLDCRLFGKKCIPSNPVGPCMVSSEGACAAYYKYK